MRKPQRSDEAPAIIKRVAARIAGTPIVASTATDSPIVASTATDYSQDIVAFVRDILHATPTDYQVEILNAFMTKRRVAVRGAHGMGKTALSAWIVCWAIGALKEETKVITTASAWRQLIHYTWPEIHKWATGADWKKLGLTVRDGQEILTLQFNVGNKMAFAAASDNASALEGAHAANIVAVFDEAKAIPNAIFDAIEGAFSTGNAYALAISTPGEPTGRFYDIHARKPGFSDWWVRHVTLDEAIAAGRISREWAEQRALQWGEKSAVYQSRVLGEFAASGEDTVIPLAWVEAANERWRDNNVGTGDTALGVDPARYGEDKTTIAVLRGNVIETINAHTQADTMQTTGYVITALGGYPATSRIGVDVIGIGAGVYDRLREQGYETISVNAGEGTDVQDETGTLFFLNVRAAMWWGLRERLNPDKPDALALPPDDKLTGDLVAPKWSITSSGRIKIESKDEIRKRIGRSTDYADAVCAALWAMRQPNHPPPLSLEW